MRSIGALRSENFDVHIAKRVEPLALEQPLGPADEVVAEALGLLSRVAATDEHQAEHFVTVDDLCAGLERGRGRLSASACDLDSIGPHLGEIHVAPIACHVGQEVFGRIANLVQQLLGNGADVHEAASPFGFREHERTVGSALGKRVAEVVPHRDVLPVGQQATGRLRPAFQKMPGEASLSQRVEVFGPPTELVDQRPERESRVDAAARDDDVGARIERGGDRPRPEVRVEAQRRLDERRAVAHLGEPELPELTHARDEVVALDPRDAKLYAGLRRHSLKQGRGGSRIDTARVCHDPHALLANPRKVTADHLDHIGGVAEGWVGETRPREDPHRDLCQRLEQNIVTPARVEQLRSRKRGIPPRAGRTPQDHLTLVFAFHGPVVRRGEACVTRQACRASQKLSSAWGCFRSISRASTNPRMSRMVSRVGGRKVGTREVYGTARSEVRGSLKSVDHGR